MMKKDKRGVFGLTAVQGFFMIILSIALLAYVIIVVMGTLSTSTILTPASGAIINESSFIANNTGYTLGIKTNNTNCSGFVITRALNTTSGVDIPAANYSVNSISGLVKNNTLSIYYATLISYTYSCPSTSQLQADSILGNTAGGISGFFGSITPVYAILAILIIILVLVVLVRVVQGGRQGTPGI